MIKNNTKVSILIPLYNAQKYISQAIDSCLEQTYKDIEIIIVDDGSSDSSLSIALEYEKRHSNIIVETQKNSGAAVARNKAFELSSGGYIQYLDADDVLHKDKIRIQMEYLLNEDEHTIVYGKWGIFQSTIKNTVWLKPPVPKNYNDSRQFLLDLWASGRAVTTILWLVPRNLIIKSRGWNEKLSTNDDGEFFARVVYNASKVVYMNKSLSYYRTDNNNSLSRNINQKALLSIYDSFETYINLFRQDIDKYDVRESLALVYSNYLFLVYPSNLELVKKTENKLKYLGFNKAFLSKKHKYYYLSKLIGVYNIIRIKKLLGR
ncbi:MAG TPA: glycosyltransferase family 2 protein [Arcobacter sp.]|nr:glycosyltransferase family 2 protein [Arcobacter sp.]